jgi:3-oxoacyl-[acyl-carrier protein] reductase
MAGINITVSTKSPVSPPGKSALALDPGAATPGDGRLRSNNNPWCVMLAVSVSCPRRLVFAEIAIGATTDMSLLYQPFNPAREAALVTGAGNGIGRAIALGLVGEGVRTVFADVNPETVAAAVNASPRPELAVPFVSDLADRAACDALLADAQSAVGQVTHFVHSASPARREADHAMAVSPETWAQMHAVNVDAGFHLARELARKLIVSREPGSFLFLTSLHAGTPRNLPHYSTAKAALAMLVKELARAYGRFGIRVNALVPGAIAAGGFVADPSLARHIPLGRLGRSEDLAPMALAVLSNRVSAYVTGSAIVVDGGLSLMNWFDPPHLGDV